MFRRFIARVMCVCLLIQNLSFATQSIIELDFKDAAPSHRLPVMLRLSNISDVDHVEIDTDQQQVIVYRQEPQTDQAEELQETLEGSESAPRVVNPILIPQHDVHNLPWELESERLTLFILQQTAWLTPLHEDGYKLEFRSGLLGGGGNISIGRTDRGNGGFTQGSGSGYVKITPYCPSNPHWKKDGKPCGKPQYTPPVDKWQQKEQKKVEQWHTVPYGGYPGGRPKQDIKKEEQQKKIQSEKQAQIVCELQKKKENPLLYADYEHMKHLQQLINTDSWENVFKYADKVGISRSDVLKIDRLEKMTFEGFMKKTNPFYESYEHKKHLQQLINNDSWENVFKYADKAGISRSDVLKVDRLEKMTFTGFMQKTNPFYGNYEKVKHIQTLIQTTTWEAVYNYADKQGFTKEEVQYVNSRRTEALTFDSYMTEVFDDQVLEDWGVKDWKEAFGRGEDEVEFLQVGGKGDLVKEILKFGAQKGGGFLKKGWQKAVQAYKGDLVKGLKIDQKTLNKIPKEFGEARISRNGRGLRWEKDNGNHIRISKGNPNADFPPQRVDHARITINGKVIKRDGTGITADQFGVKTKQNADVHIPLEELATILEKVIK